MAAAAAAAAKEVAAACSFGGVDPSTIPVRFSDVAERLFTVLCSFTMVVVIAGEPPCVPSSKLVTSTMEAGDAGAAPTATAGISLLRKERALAMAGRTVAQLHNFDRSADFPLAS